MTYEDALHALAALLDEVGIGYRIERPATAGELPALLGPALAAQIAEHGWLSSEDIPLPAEDLRLYALSDLAARQDGYGIVAGSPSPGWDASQGVIGDWLADPICVDPAGGVWVARHGTGAWQFRQVATDLAALLQVLLQWLRFYLLDHQRRITGDDHEVLPAIKAAVRSRVLGDLPEPLADNFHAFLFD